MKKFVLLLLLLLAQVGVASAQNVVSGVVTDGDGAPLHGAAVRTLDSKQGTATDEEGRFTLNVAPGTQIRVSFIGFITQTLKSSAKKMSIRLEEDAKLIKQVVVNGYQQTDVRKTTGTVSMLTEKDLKDQPLANVDQLMQGKMAGVNISTVSGRPGQSAKVRIRGISSITGNNEPLWVVDGVPLQKEIPAMGSSYVRSGDFSTLYANGVAGIAPQNIESITVLKDAAASAIYGSQAQAGVIVITTKKGKAGRPQISYSGSVSLQSRPTRDDNLMNSQQKLAYEDRIWQEFSADRKAAGRSYPRIGLTGMVRGGLGEYAGMTSAQQDAYLAQRAQHTTDWFDELFRTTASTSHSVSLSGGSEQQTYYVSAGVNTNNGIVKRTSSDGYNFMTRISGTPTKNLSYDFSMDYNYLKSKGSSLGFDIFNYAYFANPYERPYNEDGSYASDNTYFNVARNNGAVMLPLPPNGFNVMREIKETDNTNTSSGINLRGNLTWRITEDLRLTGLVGYSYSNDVSENLVGAHTYSAWNDRPFEGSSMNSQRIYGNWTQAQTTNQAYLARIQANYTHLWNRVHRLSATAGSEVRKNMSRASFQKQYGYDEVTGNHNTPTLLLPYGKTTYTEEEMKSYKDIINSLTGQSKTDNAFASFYGTADYIYDNRYVVNATVRSDGSNNFGAAEQFNLIWSTGLAWNIDEEKFMKPLQPILSRASLRLSTGVTGGVNKSVYPVLIMNYNRNYRDSDTESFRLGTINNAPNEHLRWERTHDWNAGLDLGFLNDRYTLGISAYRRKGTDLVTPVLVVSTSGYTRQSYNTSEQLNQGIEFMLGATLLRVKDWRWSLHANIAYNHNVLTKYVSPTGSPLGDIYVDYPLGKVFTGKPTGINPETGFYDFQLRSDAVIADSKDLRNTDNYLFYIGTSNAPWNGGISTNLSYKNFTLSANTSFQLRGLIRNTISQQSGYGLLSGSRTNDIQTYLNDIYTGHLNKPADAIDYWTPANRNAAYPRLVDAYGEDIQMDDKFVLSSIITDAVFLERCGYLKLNSVSLSYSLPSKALQRTPLSSAGISFTANNLAYWTNYKGLNPESPGAIYPVARSYSLGVSLGF